MMVQPPAPALEDLIAEVADLRPLSDVATRVLLVTRDDSWSAQSLSTVISSDPALSAKLLRMANSAYYSFPRRIGTVPDAVVLLGSEAVRSAVLASCVINALQGHNVVPVRTFWHFSVTVALLAEALARELHLGGEEAFTAGILHNIGRLALDQHRPEMLAGSIAQAAAQGKSVPNMQRELFGYTDADLGGGLARRWNFPEPLVEAIRRHEFRADDLPDPTSLAACVVRARIYARSARLSDGIDSLVSEAPSEALAGPLLPQVVAKAGGLENITDRATTFLQFA